jgi:hypothetical protein
MSEEQATPIILGGAFEAIANNMPVMVSDLAKAWTLEEEAMWEAIDDLKPEPKPETWRDLPPLL